MSITKCLCETSGQLQLLGVTSPDTYFSALSRYHFLATLPHPNDPWKSQSTVYGNTTKGTNYSSPSWARAVVALAPKTNQTTFP